MRDDLLQVLLYELFSLHVHGVEQDRPEAPTSCDWLRQSQMSESTVAAVVKLNFSL